MNVDDIQSVCENKGSENGTTAKLLRPYQNLASF